MTSVPTTPPELVDLIAQLADNKLFLGRRYAEWCTGAPTLEAAVAAASMAQDEIGHARSFYPLLQDLVGASEETEPETRTQFVHAALLGRPFEGWTDFVAVNLLLDTALTIVLEAARESAFVPLAQRARRILEEEPLHWLHGEGWTRRLATAGDGVRAALITSLAVTWPASLQVLNAAAIELVPPRILDATGAALRERFEQRVQPVLRSAQLELPL